MFQGFTGALDGAGAATSVLALPAEPALCGPRLFTAAVTFDVTANGFVIRDIGGTGTFTIP